MLPRNSRRLLLRLLLGISFVIQLHAAEESLPPGYVFGVTVNSAQQLDVVLDRAEDLRALFKPGDHNKIAIVLHGDELQLFQKSSYPNNQSLVERARLLDQDNIIDIKACQTRMRILDIEQSELPSFIEQVPFAPAEIERLVEEEGFTEL
jgi:intracellular sulfur oxidation DsrE/DsrF family protein